MQAQPAQVQPQAVQAAVPAGAQQQVGPVVLMLQPDGTYKPAQVVLYNVAGAQAGQMPATQAVQQQAVQAMTMQAAPAPAAVQQGGTQAAQVTMGSVACVETMQNCVLFHGRTLF